MKAPCEQTANRILPALRAEIARNLICNYHMKQTEVSHLLGITQGAVNHYISGFRGQDKKLLGNYPVIKECAQKMAKTLKNGEKITVEEMCKACKDIRKKY